jgi:hypothetical protein
MMSLRTIIESSELSEREFEQLGAKMDKGGKNRIVYEISEQSDFCSDSEESDIEDQQGPSAIMSKMNALNEIMNPSY